jgi:hypothetical protein
MANRVSAHLNQPTQAPAHGRRAILAGAVAAIVAAPALASSPVDDPIYPVWRRWRSLEEECANLATASRETWDAMPGWARNPRVLVLEGKDNKGNLTGSKFYATTPAEIREILCLDHPMSIQAMPAARSRRQARAAGLEAELQAAIEAAEAEQERCGYAALHRRWDAAIEEQDPLINQIERSASYSPVALAAKIDVAFAHSGGEGFFVDLPYSPLCSILRSIHSDLPGDMQTALARAAVMEGEIGRMYRRRAQS